MFLRRDRLDITTRMSATEPCGAPATRDRRSALVSFEKTLIEDRVRSHRFLTADDVRSCAQQSLQADELATVERFFDEMEGNDGWISSRSIAARCSSMRDLLLDGRGRRPLFGRAPRVARVPDRARGSPSGATLPDIPFRRGLRRACACDRRRALPSRTSPEPRIDPDPGV
jgi:hypothetical protein